MRLIRWLRLALTSKADWQKGGFGLYVHWPFCLSKCPYCDFNSHVSGDVNHSDWQAALVSEVNRVGRLDTIFFGGGTPSLMAPDTVAAVIDTARANWAFADDIEISLEANPTSIEIDKFKAFAAAGVNRVSMGAQALNDTDLRALGRTHSAAEARKSFDIAKACFDRVSFDLIYARPHQTLAAWQAELHEAIEMSIDHLSLYQLTIEQGTRFAELYDRGKLSIPPDQLAADLYEATQDICGAAGMPAYEVSNHARAGMESRHNLIYWRYGDYAGIGPGAHGRITTNGQKWATTCEMMPAKWLQMVQQAGSAELEREEVLQNDQATEYLMMSLRLKEGTELERYADLAGEALDQARIRPLIEAGMIKQSNRAIWATDEGRMILNTILAELLV